MHDQDDILEVLSQYDEMSTFDFREKLGIYPRRLLNTILLDAGLVEKFVKNRRVMWRITEEGRSTLSDEDKVDTFAVMSTLEISEELAKDIKEVESVPKKEKKRWLKRFKKRMSKR